MIPQFRAAAKPASWTPLLLGADLIEWLDAEQAAQFNTPTGAITQWTDSVLSRVYGATGGTRPVRSLTSFNGRPGMTFDGVDDVMTCTNTTGIPTGSTAFWRWAVVDQLALVADTNNKSLWGVGSAINTGFVLQRRVTGGVNRAFGSFGTGAASVTVTQTSTDFSGRHLVLCKYAGGAAGAIDLSVDTVAGTGSTVTASVATTRATLGATPDVGRTLPAPVVINTLITTAALSAGNEALMNAYLMARL